MSLLRTAATRSFAVGWIHGAAPMATFLPLWSRSFSNTTGVYKKDMIKSAPGWDSDLASESEADVKADRDPLPRNVAELQRETIEVIREKDSVASNMREFDQATNKLEEEVHRVGQEMNQHGKKIMKGMDHMVEEAFDVLKELERFPKNAKNRIEYAEDEVVEDVKDGTQKVGHFMKETLDSVKRTVGLGTEDTTDKMNAEKIKKKVKNVDDKVDNDRGA